MPYLTDEKKEMLDANCDIGNLAYELSKESIQDFAGDLNYLNFLLVKKWINKNGKKYFIFAAIVGTLICCVLEIYRRLIAPYEDKKIQENGDVE